MGSTTTRHRRRVTGHDNALVARLRTRDADAFDELYRRHLPALTRYVATRLRGRDRDAVDDCVHDAFCDALADPRLIGTDALGSLLRLAARAVTRHDWSRRRYVRAAYTVYEDTTRPASRPPGRRPSSRYGSATPWPACPTTSAAPFNCATWTGTQPPR